MEYSEWNEPELFGQQRIQALITLLDDNDPQILDQIWDELVGYGAPIINVLESEWERFSDPLFQSRIEHLIEEIKHPKLLMLKISLLNITESYLIT